MPDEETCDPFQHDWKEVYYGYECQKCGLFVAFGCEYWLEPEEEEEEEE